MSEREDKLKAAKKKLKAFRARQAGKAVQPTSHSTSSGEPVASSSRVSLDSPTRKARHAHKKSTSRAMTAVVPQPSPRRNSTRRHSRTDSICNVHSMVTEIAQPPSESFATWTFPRSPSVPSTFSPDTFGSPFAASSRNSQPRRASLQHPPLSPSAGSAMMQGSGSSLGQRRTSLQLEVPSAASTPIVSSIGGSSILHARRASRHSRHMSIGGGRESLEVMVGQSFTEGVAATVAEPAPETDRTSALEVLEGRSPTQSKIDLTDLLPDGHVSANKRSSWGMTPSLSNGGIAQAGGRGAVDLGMLVEEEEDETTTVGDVHPSPSSRRRPQSLFLPSAHTQTVPAQLDGTTTDMLSPTEEAGHPFSASTPNGRGLRPLSMILSPPSAGQSPTEVNKVPGLRSLTLGNATVAPSSNVRRSVLSSSTSVTAGSRSSRRISVGPAPTAAGKRSSISYRSATPTFRDIGSAIGDAGDDLLAERSQLLARIASLEQDAGASASKHRVLEAENAASQAILKAKEAELSVAHVKMASLQAELQSHGDLGMRVVELESQLAESCEQYNSEIDALREKCNDAILERDDLKEDVDGWRARCADLAKAVERERARVEEERREGAAAREQVRKLGERLAATSSATAAARASAEEALAEAQAKLITEMRDQIFSLAGQLERERAAHASTRAALAASPSMQEAQEEVHMPPDEKGSDAGSSITSGSLFEGRHAFNMTADTSFSTVAGDDSFSVGKMPEQAGIPISLGGLQTLAEEEEDEEEETAMPQLEPSSAADHGLGSGGSTCSTASEAMPKTPIREMPPTDDHQRSHSFMKNWKFPMGSVEQVQIVDSEDNSFFGISQAEILPPLEVDVNLLTLPPFATADLVVDPDWDKVTDAESSKPVVTSTPIAPMPATKLAAPVKPKGAGRLSLAHFGNLFSSYVAPPPAPAPQAKELHGDTRRESWLFTGDKETRTAAPASVPRHTISAHEAKRPRAGPLAELDFTTACACKATVVLRI